MDVTILKIAALFYLLAGVSFALYVFFQRDIVSKLSPLIVACGFAAHTLALGVHFFQTGYPNVTQFRAAPSLYRWWMVAAYLVVQFKYRLSVLGSIIAPLAFLMTLAAFAFGTGSEALPPELKSYWLPVAVTRAFLGNPGV